MNAIIKSGKKEVKIRYISETIINELFILFLFVETWIINKFVKGQIPLTCVIWYKTHGKCVYRVADNTQKIEII